MIVLLLVAAIALLVIAFVSAYYIGKAELTVSQMFAQREVSWCYFGAYGLWRAHDLLTIDYSVGHIIFRFFVFVAVGVLLIPVYNRGVRRKQAQREE